MTRTTPVNAGYTIIPGTTTGSNGSKVDTWIEYKVLSQSVANNTSEIRVILYSQATQSLSTAWTQTYNYGYVGYNNANKQYLSISGYNFSNKQLIKFADHTFVISHNSDGTKSITINGAWSGATNTHTASSYISGGSVSGSVSLPNIYQSSTLVLPESFTIGTAANVGINKYQASHTSDITFSLGGVSTTLYTKTSATSVSVTIPTSYLSKITDSVTGTGTMTITTYEGDNATGSRNYSVTVRIPDTEIPVVNAIVADEVGSVPLSWHNTFVQGKSKIKITMSATAPTGATIDHYVIDGLGNVGDSPLISDIIPTSGVYTVSGYAVDSRGRRSDTASLQITVYEYSVPRIDNISVFRCNMNGNADTSGTYLSVTARGNYAPCNGQNYVLLYVRIRPKNGTYGGKIALTSNVASILSGISLTSFYDVEISAEDAFANTSIEFVINSADRILNINANGKGLAIGSFSSSGANNLFEVFWDTDFKKTPTVNGVPIGGGGGNVPTKLSELQNDTGFITSNDIPPIPSRTGQLTNDSGFITQSDIPSIPTESTVAGWGFTKNTGTYSKPSGGIPKTDLASAVQTSLDKADSALQSYTESDPVFTASVAHGITQTDIDKWNNNVVPKIVRGSTTITANTKTISFPSGSFSSAPIVVASYANTGTVASGDWPSIKIFQITASNFKIAYGGSGSATYNVDYIAIEA